jgi:hypothetical protein
MESDRSNDCEQSGNQEDDELRKFEWRFGLRRGQRMQRRDFFKRLHHCHEKIKVETNHGADHEDPAPRTGEMFRVTREDGKCEERQRYDAETDGRRKTMEREKESRDRCRDGCAKKPFGPAVEAFAAQHSKQNNDAGKNCDEANQRVNNGVDVQDHDDPITSVLGDRKARLGANAPLVHSD